MAVVHAEMESFISKFLLLAQNGVNTSLSFDSNDGKVTVNFKAELGFLNPPTKSKHHADSSHVTKPSRVRRRHRRKAERAAKTESNNNDVQENFTYDLSGEHEHTANTDEIVLSPLLNTLPDSPDNLTRTLTNSTKPNAVQTTDCATLVKPNLTLEKLAPVDIAPGKLPCLSIESQPVISIPPKKIYHPAIINACYAITGKHHPNQLLPEEVKKFKAYIDRKREMGEPVESDLLYVPTSMRNCMHCGHPT